MRIHLQYECSRAVSLITNPISKPFIPPEPQRIRETPNEKGPVGDTHLVNALTVIAACWAEGGVLVSCEHLVFLWESESAVL